MENILLEVLGLLFEVFVELCGEAALSLAIRGVASASQRKEPMYSALAMAGYVLLGSLAGAFSLFLLPHPLVRSMGFRGISLLLSPALTGLTMSLTGSYLERHGKNVTRIETFAYGFAFAFGMALVRFLYTR